MPIGASEKTEVEELKMRFNLIALNVFLAVVAFAGPGSVRASLPPQSPGEREKDHSAVHSGRASTLLAEIQREARELLAEIQWETANLQPNPYALSPFTQNPHTNPRTHGEFLFRAKGRINAVEERVAELQRLRRYLLPWQQQAIVQVTSHATQVAASIHTVIADLRENRNRLFVSTYRSHLIKIADHSEDLKQTVDDFLDRDKSPQDAFTVTNHVVTS